MFGRWKKLIYEKVTKRDFSEGIYTAYTFSFIGQEFILKIKNAKMQKSK
jgi:hypothetical protein